MENIRPSADLRNKYSEMSKICRETQEAVYITVNGRGDTVLLNISHYNQMKAELKLLKLLAEAEEDIAKGNIAPMQETIDSIRAKLLEQSNQK